MRVLVIDDSEKIRHALVMALRQEGYAVDDACDGHRGLIHLRTTEYDAAILDVMLPGRDGFEVLAEARRHGVRTPILLLTARDAIDDRVRGLRAGADDYVVKPFALDEVLARLAAILRRSRGLPSDRLSCGALQIDLGSRCVTFGNTAIELSRREFNVLAHLASRRGKVVSRDELEEHIYDDRSQVMSNSIDSAVSILRRKLSASGCDALIHTKRGAGYMLDGPADVDP